MRRYGSYVNGPASASLITSVRFLPFTFACLLRYVRCYGPGAGAGVLAAEEVEVEAAAAFAVVETAAVPADSAGLAGAAPGAAMGDAVGREAVPYEPSTLTPLDVSAFRISTSPLICADCSNERLISRLSMLPLVDLITAGGCGWPAGGNDAAAMGMIPRAARAGSELTGSCTGIAVALPVA